MKKTAILLVSFLVFSISVVNAENAGNASSKNTVVTTSVTGKVLDKITGEALVGVKVSIQGTDKATYTDFEGNFEIDGVMPGAIELNTSYISYKEKVENINIDLEKSNIIDVKVESL